MSRTATRDDRTLDQASGPAASQLVPPPKLRRRPALLAAALVAICLGALLAAWAWTATTNTQEVLVARHTIERGAVIEADDLARVRVSADPALTPVSASQFDQVVGQRAAYDVAAGGMLTPDSFTSGVVPDGSNSVVGVALTPAQAPGLESHYGRPSPGRRDSGAGRGVARGRAAVQRGDSRRCPRLRGDRAS